MRWIGIGPCSVRGCLVCRRARAERSDQDAGGMRAGQPSHGGYALGRQLTSTASPGLHVAGPGRTHGAHGTVTRWSESQAVVGCLGPIGLSPGHIFLQYGWAHEALVGGPLGFVFADHGQAHGSRMYPGGRFEGATSTAQRGPMLGHGERASPGMRPGQVVLEAGCAAGYGPESSVGTPRMSDVVFRTVCRYQADGLAGWGTSALVVDESPPCEGESLAQRLWLFAKTSEGPRSVLVVFPSGQCKASCLWASCASGRSKGRLLPAAFVIP